MTRERVEKAIERMKQFYKNRTDLVDPTSMFDHKIYNEAFIRAMMEFEEDELDYETRKWFEEDEDKYAKLIEKADRDVLFETRFRERLGNIYYELEEKEETK